MIKIGDIVRVKESHQTIWRGKLGIVVVKGTWSADISIIGTNSGLEPRIALEHLEVIA